MRRDSWLQTVSSFFPYPSAFRASIISQRGTVLKHFALEHFTHKIAIVMKSPTRFLEFSLRISQVLCRG